MTQRAVPRETALAAVDIGASSGRVVLGRLDGGRLVTEVVARFGNEPVERPAADGPHLHWDLPALFAGVRDGLRAAAARAGRLDAIGVDTWAVDYGILDGDGRLAGLPFCYRDRRNEGLAEAFGAAMPPAEHYAISGLQVQPFNTAYQLTAAVGRTDLRRASSLLLIPDLIGYLLTGRRAAEVTNASTTGLLDITRRRWSERVVAATSRLADVRVAPLLPELVEPGTRLAPVRASVLPDVRDGSGLATPVIAVGSHDTASAVLGVPAGRGDLAYVSCGTWSLVGLELERPVLSEASRRANFTNELGVDSTVRYLKNVMGLWLLSQCQRQWREAGLRHDLAGLLAAAADAPALRRIIDAEDPRLLAPGDMPQRIAALLRESGQPAPQSQGELVRCIVDSLALAYGRALRDACRLAGREVATVHIVGGGARNELLCQLTADACGRPVVAGPVEATAIGNLLVQGRALGAVAGGLAELRRVGATVEPLRHYAPGGDADAWRAAEARIA